MEARALVVWASIWLARTEGEGGKGTERAKERARLGVWVRAAVAASELDGRGRRVSGFTGDVWGYEATRWRMWCRCVRIDSHCIQLLTRFDGLSSGPRLLLLLDRLYGAGCGVLLHGGQRVDGVEEGGDFGVGR